MLMGILYDHRDLILVCRNRMASGLRSPEVRYLKPSDGSHGRGTNMDLR